MVELAPEKGKLLIAEPSILNDSSFNRSIILLTEHSEQNSVGFILNRPLNLKIANIIPEINCDFLVYQGGPVEQDNLYFVHRTPDLISGSIEVGNGIFWGGNFEPLKELLERNLLNQDNIRFFLGYTGWGTNQLLDEIKSNSWFVSENDFSNIFSISYSELWKKKLLQKGGEYKIWSNAPYDVQLN